MCQTETENDQCSKNCTDGQPTRCQKCPESNQPAWIKPDITFFGEEMPTRFEEMIREDCPAADLCLIMGTSLMVLDFCLLPNFVPKDCPRVVINREPVGIFNNFSFFNDVDCGRDIFHPSSCDEASLLMASALGVDLS